jgi:23S rRNA pseudouridine1911/1915/1917 synthase
MSNEQDIKILYEDDNVMAVNKPAGLMVHPDGRAKGPFLTDWIMRKYPQTLNVGEPARTLNGENIARPGIVHRLDRETSGVLLVAKTQKGFECLKKQFQARTVKKKYLALVWGELEEEFGTIKRPIGRSLSDFRKWSAQRGARGELREAETYWTKVANVKINPPAGGQNGKLGQFSLIEVEPKTGRTHQIRVHFAAIQHPIVGDLLYAPKRPQALDFKRTALHSKSIEFENCEGKNIKVEAPLPDDFQKIRGNLET